MAGIRIGGVAVVSTFIPYVILQLDGNYNIWALVNGTPTQLSNDTFDVRQSPELSPDGTKITYERNSTGFTEVWVMDVDGSNDTMLDDGGGATYCQYPTWAPDSSLIVYTISQIGSNEGGEVYTIEPDGTNKTLIHTPATDYEARRPRYNFDGSRIAFIRGPESGSGASGFQLWTMDADGTNDTSIKTLIAGHLDQSQFGWANSEDTIAYYSGNTGGTFGAIRKISGDGTGDTLLSITSDGTTLLTLSARCWSSSDDRVFYTLLESGALGAGYYAYEALADGSDENLLYNGHIMENTDTLRSVWRFFSRLYFVPTSDDRLSSITVGGADYQVNHLLSDDGVGDLFYAETAFQGR